MYCEMFVKNILFGFVGKQIFSQVLFVDCGCNKFIEDLSAEMVAHAGVDFTLCVSLLLKLFN